MISIAVSIIFAIIILIAGIVVGAVIALDYALKELEKIEKVFGNYVEHYKDITNTAIRSAAKFESRCKELEVKYGEPHVE